MIERVSGNFSEMAFLGNEIQRNQTKMDLIDRTAQTVFDNHILNPQNGVEKSMVDGRVKMLIGGLNGGANNVPELLRLAKSGSTLVATDSIRATEAIDTLGKSLYIVMRYSGDDDLRNALSTPDSVNDVLPEAMYGLGDSVMKNVITNGQVFKELRNLDQLQLKAGKMGEVLGKAFMAKKLDEAMERLAELEVSTQEESEEVDTVLALVSTMRLNFMEPEKTGPIEPATQTATTSTPPEDDESARSELEKLQLEYYQREMELKDKLEIVSQEEWLDGLMSKSYEKAQIPSQWMYSAPEWMRRNGRNETKMLSEWRSIYALAEGLSYAVVQKRGDNRFSTDVDYIKSTIIGMYSMKEKKLKKLYEDRDGIGYGFREALETMVDDLFVMNEDLNILEFKPEDRGGSVKQFMDDASVYKIDLANRLAKNGSPAELARAEIMVSIATDFLEMGGVFDSADSQRHFGDGSDALRTLMRPEQKFGPKLKGGELWGGNLGLWAMSVTGFDKVAAKKLLEDSGMMPRMLAGSALNLMVDTDNGKMSLARALKSKTNVKFSEKASDFYFSWKKDQIMSACDMWLYLSGKNELLFKSFQDVTQPINKWRTPLHNATIGLRETGEKLGLNLCPIGILEGAIAASTTIWPFRQVYLRVDMSDEATKNPNFYDNYIDTAGNIVRAVAQSEDERKRLMEHFGVSNKGVKNLYQMAVDYDLVTNETVSLAVRKAVQGSHGWKFI